MDQLSRIALMDDVREESERRAREAGGQHFVNSTAPTTAKMLPTMSNG
jgi:hypothetical protein